MLNLADLSGGGEAIFDGHVEVEEDEVRAEGGELVDCVLAVDCFGVFEALGVSYGSLVAAQCRNANMDDSLNSCGDEVGHIIETT